MWKHLPVAVHYPIPPLWVLPQVTPWPDYGGGGGGGRADHRSKHDNQIGGIRNGVSRGMSQRME